MGSIAQMSRRRRGTRKRVLIRVGSKYPVEICPTFACILTLFEVDPHRLVQFGVPARKGCGKEALPPSAARLVFPLPLPVSRSTLSSLPPSPPFVLPWLAVLWSF
eukprot:2434777-Rhodomonas_salina.1